MVCLGLFVQFNYISWLNTHDKLIDTPNLLEFCHPGLELYLCGLVLFADTVIHYPTLSSPRPPGRTRKSICSSSIYFCIYLFSIFIQHIHALK